MCTLAFAVGGTEGDRPSRQMPPSYLIATTTSLACEAV